MIHRDENQPGREPIAVRPVGRITQQQLTLAKGAVDNFSEHLQHALDELGPTVEAAPHSDHYHDIEPSAPPPAVNRQPPRGALRAMHNEPGLPPTPTAAPPPAAPSAATQSGFAQRYAKLAGKNQPSPFRM